MGFFSRKKESAPAAASKPAGKPVEHKATPRKMTVSNPEELAHPRDLADAVNQMNALADYAKLAIPTFQIGEQTDEIRVLKVAENGGKSQPYLDRVQVMVGSDIFHFWFYPSGKVWKAECYFWPRNCPGFSMKVRRPNNLQSEELAIENLGIQMQINTVFTASASM